MARHGTGCSCEVDCVSYTIISLIDGNNINIPSMREIMPDWCNMI